GSAALLVLPYRGPDAGLGGGQGGGQAAGPATPQPAPPTVAALLYTPFAVVPPAVAEELCGLMRDMEWEAAAAAPPDTDPRVTRARAFTQHFSSLVSDMVSLLLGCERAVAMAAQIGTEEQEQELLMGELQQLGAGLVGYLRKMEMRATLQYVLNEVQAAGLIVNQELLLEPEDDVAAGAAEPPRPLDDNAADGGGDASVAEEGSAATTRNEAAAAAAGAAGDDEGGGAVLRKRRKQQPQQKLGGEGSSSSSTSPTAAGDEAAGGAA
ncbi:hypothetical protein Agub_g4968, partial [Astrephomene gubernaculifera]